MKRTYLLANLFWVALAVPAAIEAWRLNVGDLHRPGPGFLPFYAAALLGILALVSLVQDLKSMSGPASSIWGGVRWGRWAIMILALFTYVAVLERLGFFLATFVLMLVLFRLLEPYRLTTVLLFSILTMASAYFFFVYLLESRLPLGIFGF